MVEPLGLVPLVGLVTRRGAHRSQVHLIREAVARGTGRQGSQFSRRRHARDGQKALGRGERRDEVVLPKTQVLNDDEQRVDGSRHRAAGLDAPGGRSAGLRSPSATDAAWRG